MIELVQHDTLGVGFRQQRFAEGMKRRQRHRFAALACGLHHAGFHFAGGLFRECQPENILAGERVVRLQQLPDALGDDARFSGSRAGNHQQRPFAVRDRTPLRVIQLQPALFQRRHVKQRGHDSGRVSDCEAKGKRRLQNFSPSLTLRLLPGGNLLVELARLPLWNRK